MIESSPAIYCRVNDEKRSVPTGRLNFQMQTSFIRPAGTGKSVWGLPGDKSPGYSQISLRDFNPAYNQTFADDFDAEGSRRSSFLSLLSFMQGFWAWILRNW
jgi:uncharacterized membrane protein